MCICAIISKAVYFNLFYIALESSVYHIKFIIWLLGVITNKSNGIGVSCNLCEIPHGACNCVDYYTQTWTNGQIK